MANGNIDEPPVIHDPAYSQMFCIELTNLLSKLESLPVGLILERALRAYANTSPAFRHHIQQPPGAVR